MPKKVLYIIDGLSEGAGRVLYDLVKFLKNYKIIIVTLYKEGNLIDQFKKLNVKIINLNKKPGIRPATIIKLKNIIKKEKPDIVHTHNCNAYEFGVLAARILKVKKIIHTAHGKSVKPNKLKKLRESLFHKFISAFLTNYISVSKDLAKYAAKNWCLNKKKIKTIYNGIDTNTYKKIKVDKSFLYNLGIKKDDILIGIVAGLRPVKSHETLIKSMQLIKKQVPNSKLLIIGDGPEKNRLINLTDKLNLKKDILFLGNRKDIVKLLNCLDVSVLPSLSECLSIALLESMSCQLPVIATDVGGNPELINKDYLVKPKDYKNLAIKTVKLLKDKDLRENIGKQNRKRVLNHFNIQNMIKNYKKVYQKRV
jgi:N-acetyl-alpha-D-glucosaminyl L-malate synthase BshA